SLLAMTFVVSSWIISCSLRARAQPLPHPGIGVGVLGDVGNDRDGIGAGGEDLGGLLELDAADRDQRNGTDALLPFADLRNALWREAHRFQRGREDRAECDIVGFGGERRRQLVIVMGGNAESQSRLAD